MSELRANTISDAAGTGPAALTKQYAAKAYCLHETVGTASITESENISSLTDNSVGVDTLTLTNAMSTVDFPSCGNSNVTTSSQMQQQRRTSTSASTIQVVTYEGDAGANAAGVDVSDISTATFGDLA